MVWSPLQGWRQYLFLNNHDKACVFVVMRVYIWVTKYRCLVLHRGHTVPSSNCVVRSGQMWTSGVQQCTYWSSLLFVLGDSKGLSFRQSLFNCDKHETSIFSTINHHWLRVIWDQTCLCRLAVVLCKCWIQQSSLFTVY